MIARGQSYRLNSPSLLFLKEKISYLYKKEDYKEKPCLKVWEGQHTFPSFAHTWSNSRTHTLFSWEQVAAPTSWGACLAFISFLWSPGRASLWPQTCQLRHVKCSHNDSRPVLRSWHLLHSRDGYREEKKKASSWIHSEIYKCHMTKNIQSHLDQHIFLPVKYL